MVFYSMCEYVRMSISMYLFVNRCVSVSIIVIHRFDTGKSILNILMFDVVR